MRELAYYEGKLSALVNEESFSGAMKVLEEMYEAYQDHERYLISQNTKYMESMMGYADKYSETFKKLQETERELKALRDFHNGKS